MAHAGTWHGSIRLVLATGHDAGHHRESHTPELRLVDTGVAAAVTATMMARGLDAAENRLDTGGLAP